MGAPRRTRAQRVGGGRPEGLSISGNLLATKLGLKGSSDTITFGGDFSGGTLISLGWLPCCPRWRYLLTFSWKPSPRSPVGTVSTSLTVDTENTGRKHGARERGMALGAYIVIPGQDRIGHRIWPQETFSPSVNST